MAWNHKNGNTRSRNAGAVAKRKRMDLVRDFLLRGETNQIAIAAAIGCSQPTVSNDIRDIFEQWREEDPKKARVKKRLRIRQLEFILAKGILGFDRSQQNAETIQTTYTPKVCDDCKGSGFEGERWCNTCGGDGEVMVETVVRKVVGQAGDSSFLAGATAVLREIAKLEGHYPDKKKIVENKGGVLHLHRHNGVLRFKGVSSETILEARTVMKRLENEMKPKVVDGEVVDDNRGEE